MAKLIGNKEIYDEYAFSPYIPLMITDLDVMKTDSKPIINYDKCLFQFNSIEYASNNTNTIFMPPGVYVGEIDTAFTFTGNIQTNIIEMLSNEIGEEIDRDIIRRLIRIGREANEL